MSSQFLRIFDFTCKSPGRCLYRKFRLHEYNVHRTVLEKEMMQNEAIISLLGICSSNQTYLL